MLTFVLAYLGHTPLAEQRAARVLVLDEELEPARQIQLISTAGSLPTQASRPSPAHGYALKAETRYFGLGRRAVESFQSKEAE